MQSRILINLRNKISSLYNFSPKIYRIFYGNGQTFPENVNNVQGWLTMLQEQKMQEIKKRIVMEQMAKINKERERIARIQRFEKVEKYIVEPLEDAKQFLVCFMKCLPVFIAVIMWVVDNFYSATYTYSSNSSYLALDMI